MGLFNNRKYLQFKLLFFNSKERYMGLLHDDEIGYNRSSVFPYLDRLREKKYFVLHGTQVNNDNFWLTIFSGYLQGFFKSSLSNIFSGTQAHTCLPKKLDVNFIFTKFLALQ
jgi:hypothetical protein